MGIVNYQIKFILKYSKLFLTYFDEQNIFKSLEA